MGDGEEDIQKITRTPEMKNLSLENSPNTFSRDLLQRFRGTSGDSVVKRQENDGVELNLGLSLGSMFGVERNTSNLMRSSSVATYLSVSRDDSDMAQQAAAEAAAASAPRVLHRGGLARTSSLPVESEEEWRKRKEMQSLRRMEAKRRRSEKQRNLRVEREGGGGSMSLEEEKVIEGNLRGRLQGEKSLPSVGRTTMGMSFWASMGKGKGSCSSTDLENKALQGSSSDLSPARIQSLQEVSNKDVASSASNPSCRPDVPRIRGREINLNGLDDMPCVFTKGDGPSGRRVDGILYKYGKGEEVRIMCVCHGTFHSPAEFVSHAGGTDVDNPLKHIVVNPNAMPLV